MEIWPAPWDRGIKIKTSMKKLGSASPYVVAFIYFSQLYFLAGHERQKQVQRQMPRGGAKEILS